MEKPLVSCMMLTYNRYKPLTKAVDCFMNQTYENRELIILNTGTDGYVNKVQQFLMSSKIHERAQQMGIRIKHYHTDKKSLGFLRNEAIDYSDGEYIMIFDDDDIHHNERIECQMDAILHGNIQGTVLRNFVAVKKKGLFRDKRHNCTMLSGLDGTLLFKKDEVWYSDMDQGEDTTFIETLKAFGHNIVIIDTPYNMYEYNYYGKNTVNENHFKEMIEGNPPLRWK